MSKVDSAIVLLPRFTTLAGATEFTTQPMDVSQYGGIQFQLWRGPFRTASPTPAEKFTVYLEESLDAQTWVLGPSAPGAHVVAASEPRFFSYGFRLRWFRVRVDVEGDDPLVTCWAEGLLRGGGDGAWPRPSSGVAGGIDIGRGSSGPGGFNVQLWLDQKNYDLAYKAWVENGMKGPPPQPPAGPIQIPDSP